MKLLWCSVVLVVILGLCDIGEGAVDSVLVSIEWDAVEVDCKGNSVPLGMIKGYRVYVSDESIVRNGGDDKCEAVAVTGAMLLADESALPGAIVSAELEYIPSELRGKVYIRVTAVSVSGKESQVSNEVVVKYDFDHRLSSVKLRLLPGR